MGQRTAIVALLAGALVADAVLGILHPGVTRTPLFVLAVVAGIALEGGVRLGMITGFAAGLLLDLVSGPVSLAGVHTLTALIAGTAVGYERRHLRASVWSPAAFASIVGGLATATAAALSVALHRLLGATVSDVFGSAAAALAVGATVTPLAQRALGRRGRPAHRPLSQRAPRA
jgi:rod shape-determining protein MreD